MALSWALREAIYVMFIGGPNDGSNAAVAPKDLKPTYYFYDWPDERRGYTPPIRRYVLCPTRETARIEVQKLRDAQEREWDRFDARDWVDAGAEVEALTKRDEWIERVANLVEHFGFENGGALYFYER